MVDFGDKVALGGSEGVIGGEVDVEEEHTSSIGTVIRADNGSLPMELIVLSGSGRAVGWGILLQIEQFLLDSFLGHLFNYKGQGVHSIYRAKTMT